MKIKDKITKYLNEGPLMDRLKAAKQAQVEKPVTPVTKLNQDQAMKNVLMKYKPALKKMLLHMQWNDNRLAISDLKKDLGDELYNQVQSFGWLQKTKHPGEFYELSDSGINALGGF